MRKQVEESTAAESARRATRPVAERDRKGRFSARRKRATVLRLLRGENLESVSRELGITAARASQWRDQFLAAGQAGLRAARRMPGMRSTIVATARHHLGELLKEKGSCTHCSGPGCAGGLSAPDGDDAMSGAQSI